MAHVAPDDRWLRINGKPSDITGSSKQDLLSPALQHITHPGGPEKDLEHVRRMTVGEIDGYCLEKRFIRKDGRRAWG
jgi:PAS domain S-box-containing protein